MTKTASRDERALHGAFTCLALYWISFGALAFVSTLFGFFSPLLMGAYLALGGGALLLQRTESFRETLLPLLPIGGVVLFMCIVWATFSTPTVFTGRDQGSIAAAAIMLADTHSLTVHTAASDAFFSFYGEGKALNFPGFFYTLDGALTTQFPLPYITWLAAFYSIFGMLGFTIGNTVLFVLFAVTFTLLAQHMLRLVAPKKKNLAQNIAPRFALLFLLTSFPFMWFFGHTLSENLAQFLIVFLVWSALQFIAAAKSSSDKNAHYTRLYFWAALVTGALLTFTRIEGIALLVTTLFVFLAMRETNDHLRTRVVSHLLAPVVAIFILLAFVFDATTNFYKMLAKAILPIGTGATAGSSGDTSFVIEFFTRMTDYLSYGILPYIAVGLFGAYLLWKKKSYRALVPLIITAPVFIYLLSPHISSDAPWALRRMAFAILPITMLYSLVYALALTHSKRARMIVAGALVAFALPATLTFFTFSENDHLLHQTRALGEQFSDNDLVLLDAGTSGSGFAMLAGPMLILQDKNAAYIFNPEDIMRVDFSRFANVFLVVPADDAERYIDVLGGLLSERADVTITTTRLTQPARTRLWDFPARDTVTTENLIMHVDL